MEEQVWIKSLSLRKLMKKKTKKKKIKRTKRFVIAR